MLEHRERTIRRVLWMVLGLNLAVAMAKLFYGLFSRSVAMQADGIHCHPYGHAKFETFTAAAIALMLGLACYTVGRE